MNRSITIDGVRYTADEATAAPQAKSRLQALFADRYGADSFQASLADFLAEWFSPSDVVLVHTSGSTGTPKPLWVEKRRMMASARLTCRFLQLKEGDKALLCMPLRYIAGKMVVVRALVWGLDLLTVTPCGHPFKELACAPHFAALIPMQVYNSLGCPDERRLLEQTRHVIIGGGAVDDEMARELRTFPHAVWSTYGMTETLSHIALRRLNGEEASEWYTPFEGVDIRLTDEQTLAINAPHVHAGELVTNDIAQLDSRGRFRILGRKDNTINSGGVKVQIEQVEGKLRPHLPFPFMITSAPDVKFGERIILLLQAAEADFSDRQLEEVFREELPPYWRPKQTVRTRSLPLTETGKPDRATARRMVHTE